MLSKEQKIWKNSKVYWYNSNSHDFSAQKFPENIVFFLKSLLMKMKLKVHLEVLIIGRLKIFGNQSMAQRPLTNSLSLLSNNFLSYVRKTSSFYQLDSANSKAKYLNEALIIFSLLINISYGSLRRSYDEKTRLLINAPLHRFKFLSIRKR